ncbi:hypothetical protein BDV41DRAFT_536222 [Aspergillus transmontanensis]|uniref:Uncharacterized protein n=1 Tax=Aspergillus transmontanensis TaxID=1034304 RepID=A0A5N6VZ06_9EURO|nr:hypothetical protein BDV41DRAFT_536222 [Aspergillus transmontanensis]
MNENATLCSIVGNADPIGKLPTIKLTFRYQAEARPVFLEATYNLKRIMIALYRIILANLQGLLFFVGN